MYNDRGLEISKLRILKQRKMSNFFIYEFIFSFFKVKL